MLQEEFESLKEAVSSSLGDAQHKFHDTAAISPNITISSGKFSAATPCANNICGLAEVQYDE